MEQRWFEGLSEKRKRKTGKGAYPCIRCGSYGPVIKRYGLNICRQCFREIAEELGFKKYM